MKGNGYVFGAYTHCSWPAAEGVVADPTGKSFLFSLVNAANKAVRFSLKDKERAVESSAIGLRFGATQKQDGRYAGWPNFVIMRNGLAADQKDANVAISTDVAESYQPDDDQKCDDTFLAGQVLFTTEEIEVFQL